MALWWINKIDIDYGTTNLALEVSVLAIVLLLFLAAVHELLLTSWSMADIIFSILSKVLIASSISTSFGGLVCVTELGLWPILLDSPSI